MDFLEFIDEEIKKRGWSRNQLAQKAGLSNSYFTMLSKGSRQIGPDACSKIAGALRLPREVVFQAAGLLLPRDDFDPWLEAQHNRLKTLSGDRRRLAEQLLKTLEEQEVEAAQIEDAANRRMGLAEK